MRDTIVAVRPIALDLRSENEWQDTPSAPPDLVEITSKGVCGDNQRECAVATYSAVVSTINTNRSPLLSAVVPVVIYGLRLTLDLP